MDVPKTEFGPQVYLRSQLETPILLNQLHFIQYDPTGAPKDYTGFWSYTRPADGSQAVGRRQIFEVGGIGTTSD
ncbi:MAG: hypothetical protein IPJ71_11140 [Bdellovibrionales bacterium]|nr:hypothetical protein [Bdellovibrionales bacterium]